MILDGHYLMTWMPEYMAMRVLGLVVPDPPPTAHVLVGGHIVGETIGVGVWLKLENLAYMVSNEDVFEGSSLWRRTQLVRWESLSNAVLLDTAPTSAQISQIIGFRPR